MQPITLTQTVFLALFIMVLSSCGGDNKTSKPGTASCTNSIGDVFINSVCSGWSGVSVYERSTLDPLVSREITDGSAGDLVTQKIINSGIAGHDQVLDIQYNSRSSEFIGIVRIFNPATAPQGVDMSSYATGKLIFDVKVISKSNTQANLDVAIECGWPCNSHVHTLSVSKLNQWQTIEISVKDLIAEGLDIKHVTTGFLILPSVEHQANAHFQIDNIRWQAGKDKPEPETACFTNHLDFNNWDEGKNVYFINLNSLYSQDSFDYNLWMDQIVPEIVIRPQWELVSAAWGFAISEPLVSQTQQPLVFPSINDCAGGGAVLSAQVYLPESYVVDGKMKVGLYIMYADHSTEIFTNNSMAAADMKPNGWTTIKVNLDDLSYSSDIVYTGVFFDPNGKLPSISGDIKIDNFVISYDAD